jgi:hypothetical protein
MAFWMRVRIVDSSDAGRELEGREFDAPERSCTCLCSHVWFFPPNPRTVNGSQQPVASRETVAMTCQHVPALATNFGLPPHQRYFTIQRKLLIPPIFLYYASI